MSVSQPDMMPAIAEKLVDSTATRQDAGSWNAINTRSEYYKEYVKDTEELAKWKY